MLTLVTTFGLLIFVMSGYALLSPVAYVALARRIMEWPGIVWGGAGIRLILAGALWFAAASSATPQAFRVLAVLTAIGAMMLPVMGRDRLLRLVEWVAGLSESGIRAMAPLGMALGGFLVWSSLSGPV